MPTSGGAAPGDMLFIAVGGKSGGVPEANQVQHAQFALGRSNTGQAMKDEQAICSGLIGRGIGGYLLGGCLRRYICNRYFCCSLLRLSLGGSA